MSTPFRIETFEKYLSTVRNELPEGRKYFRGQTRLASPRYPLKPSIARYPHFEEKSFRERDDLERDMLEVFNNHLVTHVQHLPRSKWEALAIAQHHGLPTRFLGLDREPTRGAILRGTGDKDGRRRRAHEQCGIRPDQRPGALY